MIKRRPSKQASFSIRRNPPAPLLQGKDYQMLRSISKGHIGTEAGRRRLASMGMISSKVASRCTITALGHKALAIAMETRQGGDVEQAPSRSDDSAAIVQPLVSPPSDKEQ